MAVLTRSNGSAAASERHAQALSVLRAAELQTGVKAARLARFAGPAASVTTSSQKNLTTAGETDLVAAEAGETRFPVALEFAHLVPGGEFAPGSVVVVSGSAGLLFSLIAASSQAGSWFAIVGAPELSLVAAAQAGVDLARTALIPDPGLEAPTVIAALLNAMPVVVGERVRLLDSDRRRLAARARERGTLLFGLGAWPGAQLVYSVTGARFTGTDRGAGWVQGGELELTRTGRASAAPLAALQAPWGGQSQIWGQSGGY